jgi:hypothetical protein
MYRWKPEVKRPRIRRRHILWLLILLGLLAPFIASFMPFRHAESEEPDLAELMAKAAMYANQSLHGITRVLDLLSPGIDDPQGLAASAYRVSKLLEAESHKIIESGFSGLIRRALLSYSNMSMASAYALPSLDKLHIILLNLSRALSLVEECKIDEAISLYKSLQGEVSDVKQNLTTALEHSVIVDLDSLLSLDHKDIALNLTKKLREAVLVLREAERFFTIIEQYRDSINKLCGGGNISKSEAESLAKDLMGINPRQAGPLAYNEASAARSILARLGGYPGSGVHGQYSGGQGGQSTGMGTSQQSGQGYMPGEGAGYRAPPSDD